MSVQSTIPGTKTTLEVRGRPEHSLTKLDFVIPPDSQPALSGDTIELRLINTSELLGTIPASSNLNNVRWQDVDTPQAKRAKIETEREDERTISLLSQLPLTMRQKDAYMKTPFPHGTHSIEELALIGAKPFETVMNCYNHWFAQVAVMDRVKREIKQLSIEEMTENELKQWEEKVHKLWKDAHMALMRRSRASGRR